ncbi:MAG TPA: gamma-glutamyltransferase [Bacteroidota bacterium]|jgi:gamma-glutamyltranspeptidase/glutathione hydrolase|nr:gamma-glutamyltransferase [Bacteroidota bacterium]
MDRYSILLILMLVGGIQSSRCGSRSQERAKHGMVVSADRLASQVGVDILRRGGNAVDAAVAAGFALAVVYPEAGNIGGGGFMLIRRSNGDAAVIDFREKAPQRAFEKMYLDSLGNVTDQSVDGHLSSGVPGTVAGFVKALEEYGTMKLPEVIQPAIDLAVRGFVVDYRLAASFEDYSETLLKFPSTARLFTKDGHFFREGDTLRLPDLAATLLRIRQKGRDGFYRDETARLIVGEMERGGGIISMDDLDDYEAVVREPLKGAYRGYEILSMPPPSSGGLCLLELLHLVEGYDLSSMGFHSSRAVHVMTEAMKRVFADRAEFMGDPDVVDVPVDRLVSKEYADLRRKEIDTLTATHGELVHHGMLEAKESGNTTHYGVIDGDGNIATVTYTLNDLFGSKVVVDGAGFLLNDEMDDFSSKPGVPNAYGLIGGYANAIAPNKRMLSSMCPTILLKDGKPRMVLGARGGSRIITTVFETIVNLVDFGMKGQEAVDQPRFHHQWLPDTLIYEPFCFPADVVQNLEARGHVLREKHSATGQLEAIFIDVEKGIIYGAPDPREGGVAVGY